MEAFEGGESVVYVREIEREREKERKKEREREREREREAPATLAAYCAATLCRKIEAFAGHAEAFGTGCVYAGASRDDSAQVGGASSLQT